MNGAGDASLGPEEVLEGFDTGRLTFASGFAEPEDGLLGIVGAGRDEPGYQFVEVVGIFVGEEGGGVGVPVGALGGGIVLDVELDGGKPVGGMGDEGGAGGGVDVEDSVQEV